ncbi:unnamed protein product [Caenorhabditis auriculariae]|uniref:Lipase maturation factor n=1 Tax=Caenorhabditis auriculariae TaxID=2777116 RepID=A0A8S1GWJ0_9PELO|nr:unnamed protein product [Caenorhabditis auriculariae]
MGHFSTYTVKQLIIMGQALVLLTAFSSIYWQIPGLFGEQGLMPVAAKMKCEKKNNVLKCPLSVLQALKSYFTLSPSVALQLTAIFGMIISSLVVVFKPLRKAPIFFILYSLYHTIFLAGGEFMAQEFDLLLLESTMYVGALANIFDSPADMITCFYVLYLGIKLRLPLGIMRLESENLDWWNLIALPRLYERQILPTPFSYYFSHVPEIFNKAACWASFYTDVFTTPLYLLPCETLQVFFFMTQVTAIIYMTFSGNYGFYYMNFVVLLLPLLQGISSSGSGEVKLSALLYLFCVVTAVLYFQVDIDFTTLTIHSYDPSPESLYDRISLLSSQTAFVCFVNMLVNAGTVVYKMVRSEDGALRRRTVMSIMVAALFGATVFRIGFVPSRVQSELDRYHPKMRQIHDNVMYLYNSSNAYGVNETINMRGRPEVIIEGANMMGGSWEELHFFAKPGDVSVAPRFLNPIWPRLDAQMWYAAVGNYKQNHFFLSLVYHLMEGTPDVLALMGHYPFGANKTMNFVRAKLYTYRFSKPTEEVDWWTRTYKREYMKIMNKSSKTLGDFLKSKNLLLEDPHAFKNGAFGKFLQRLHKTVVWFGHQEFVILMLTSVVLFHNSWRLMLFRGLLIGLKISLQVQLQTQQAEKLSVGQLTLRIYKNNGILAFYNGLSASVLRQLTYSTTRFGIYETVKKQFPQEKAMPFYQKALLAGFAGAAGGLVGTPADLVNVRMQNDSKLPAAQRRNYKHALDGLLRITREEGLMKMFNGATMATSRAVLMTIGQLSFYDQIKQMLIESGLAKDNLQTHFFSSFCAASVATMMTQPLDVMKTRMMNAAPGEFKGIGDCFLYTAKLGPMGFFKGFIPAWKWWTKVSNRLWKKKRRISTLAEARGYHNLKPEVAAAVQEMTRKFMLNIANFANNWAQHCHRKKVIQEDVQAALREFKHILPPLFFTKRFTNFQPAKGYGPGVYTHVNREIDVSELCHQPTQKIPIQLRIKSYFLVINGKIVPSPYNIAPAPEVEAPVEEEKPEEESEEPAERQRPHIYTMSAKELFSDCVKVGQTEQTVEVRPTIPESLSVEQQVFLKDIITTCMGQNDNKRQEALHALETDAGLQALLPPLSRVVFNAIMANIVQRCLSLTIYAVRMLKAISLNKTVDLRTMYHEIIPALMSCMLGKNLCLRPETDNHWALRDYASRTLISILKDQTKEHGDNSRPRIFKYAYNVFRAESSTAPMVYGAVAVLSEYVQPVEVPALITCFNEMIIKHKAIMTENREGPEFNDLAVSESSRLIAILAKHESFLREKDSDERSIGSQYKYEMD